MIRSIITHAGGAHKDDFLACAVLLSKSPVSIFRRDPTDGELSNSEIAIVDVGNQHDAELNNFDHHQFLRDCVPTCALSLVLQKFGIYEDAKEFCGWLETTEWFDCRGPGDTADWLGIDREAMTKLNSPLDVGLLRAFAARAEHHPGEPLWEVMRIMGAELVSFVTTLRKRMNRVARSQEIWELGEAAHSFKVAFLPRTDPLIEDPAGALAFRVKELNLEEEILALVYPDGRGDGYGMRRFNDNQILDFCNLAEEPDVHFVHNRGFIAKTSSREISRLRELLQKARA